MHGSTTGAISQPLMVGVLYRLCRIPRLLRNKKYFDLRTHQPEKEAEGMLVFGMSGVNQSFREF